MLISPNTIWLWGIIPVSVTWCIHYTEEELSDKEIFSISERNIKKSNDGSQSMMISNEKRCSLETVLEQSITETITGTFNIGVCGHRCTMS